MKKQILSFLLLPLMLLIGLNFQSCNKSEETPPIENPTSIHDMKVSSSFDWKTSKELTLTITGMPLPVTIKNNLVVTSTDDKATYLTDQLEMNKSYTLKFTIPSYLTQVKITYGTIVKTVDVIGNTMNFDYLTQE